MTGYEAVQAEVGALLRHYATALGMPGHAAAYAEAIAPAAWDAFPKNSRFHHHEVFAEVVTFHALKATGLPIDQDAFRKASLIGDMALNKRHWLLHYAQHLPPALRVASREPSPEAWLSRMPPGPVIDAARAVLVTDSWRLACMQPRTRAGAAVVVAWKRLGKQPGDRSAVAPILAAAGLQLSTAYNAAVRAGLVAEHRKTQGMHASPAVV